MSDQKAIRITATGDVGVGPTRLTGVYVDAAAGGGRLTLTDGNGGDTLFDADFAASADQYIEIPQNGIRFVTGIWTSAATNITSAVLFYDG